MTQTKTINVEYGDSEYQAEVEISFYDDDNYGSDADGNRGATRTLYKGCDILDVSEDGRDVEVWPELKAAIESDVAERFLELIND